MKKKNVVKLIAVILVMLSMTSCGIYSRYDEPYCPAYADDNADTQNTQKS